MLLERPTLEPLWSPLAETHSTHSKEIALNSGVTAFWETLGAVCENTPAKVGSGASLAYIGGNYIYALRGNSTDFLRYSVTMDSWTTLTAAPGKSWARAEIVFTHSEGGFTPQGNSTAFWEFEVTPPRYDISVLAGSVSTDTRYEIDGSTRTILFWDID